MLGHKRGKRKLEKEAVERALDTEHKKYCPICGKELMRLSPARDREVFVALQTSTCPLCGSRLEMTKEGIVFCSRRPLCKWCIYIKEVG